MLLTSQSVKCSLTKSHFSTCLEPRVGRYYFSTWYLVLVPGTIKTKTVANRGELDVSQLCQGLEEDPLVTLRGKWS